MSYKRELYRPRGPEDVVGLARVEAGTGKIFLALIGSRKDGGS